MRAHRRDRGFSLLELMVVVAILAVLSTVAIFSYKSYMRRARNAEGIAFLMDIKMKQETYFMTYSRYVSTSVDADGFFPEVFDYVPYPWLSSGTWDCSTPTGVAMTGFCALGISPTSQDTWFQYVTMGWDPVNLKVPPTHDPAWIKDTTRRWWFARARGYTGSSGLMPFEYRLSSEINEIIEIPPTD